MKIKILNRLHNIEIVEDVLTSCNAAIMRNNLNKIFIVNDIAKELRLEYLLHECVHNINHQLNLGFDEAMTDRLACGLTSLIKDNDWKKIEKEILNAK